MADITFFRGAGVLPGCDHDKYHDHNPAKPLNNPAQGTITLRPYQVEARDAVLAEWGRGQDSTLLAAATGCGKTEMALAILQAEHEAGRLGRALWLAHRKELITQPVQRILDNWTDLGRPGIVMADRDEHAARIVVATVQSLASNGRLDRILRSGPITHVVYDEVHHLLAKTNLALVRRIQRECRGLRLLGITATPRRTDGDGLKRIFGSIAYRISIRDGIRANALCPFVAVAVQLPVSFTDVERTEDGWQNETAGSILSADNAEQVVIETWRRHAEGRPTIAFTASVAQAFSLAEAFRQAGVAAEAACGETDDDVRADVVERFRRGEVQVLANAMLWTEGLDLPMIACILQIRPTQSDLIYVQMIGRGLRLAPGKTDCLIMDYVPADARDMRLAGDLLGKPRDQRKAERKALNGGVILDSFGILSDGTGIDADPDRVQLAVLDYFGQHRLAWTFDGRLASAAAGEKTILAVRLPDGNRLAKADALRASGQWNPLWDRAYREVRSFRIYAVEEQKPRLLGLAETWDDASVLAEEWADGHADGILTQRKSAWRTAVATRAQRRLLEQWGLWRPEMLRGAAAQAITHHLARTVIQ